MNDKEYIEIISSQTLKLNTVCDNLEAKLKEYAKLKKVLEKKHALLVSSQEECHRLERENAVLKVTVAKRDMVMREKEHMEIMIKQKDEVIESLQGCAEIMEKDAEEKNALKKSLEAAKESHLKEKNALKQNLEAAKKSHLKEVDKLKQQIQVITKAKEQENIQLKKELEEMKTQCEKENKIVAQKLDEKAKENIQLKQELEVIKTQYEKENIQLKQELEVMKAQCEKENIQLKKELEEIKTQCEKGKETAAQQLEEKSKENEELHCKINQMAENYLKEKKAMNEILKEKCNENGELHHKIDVMAENIVKEKKAMDKIVQEKCNEEKAVDKIVQEKCDENFELRKELEGVKASLDQERTDRVEVEEKFHIVKSALGKRGNESCEVLTKTIEMLQSYIAKFHQDKEIESLGTSLKRKTSCEDAVDKKQKLDDSSTTASPEYADMSSAQEAAQSEELKFCDNHVENLVDILKSQVQAAFEDTVSKKQKLDSLSTTESVSTKCTGKSAPQEQAQSEELKSSDIHSEYSMDIPKNEPLSEDTVNKLEKQDDMSMSASTDPESAETSLSEQAQSEELESSDISSENSTNILKNEMSVSAVYNEKEGSGSGKGNVVFNEEKCPVKKLLEPKENAEHLEILPSHSLHCPPPEQTEQKCFHADVDSSNVKQVITLKKENFLQRKTKEDVCSSNLSLHPTEDYVNTIEKPDSTIKLSDLPLRNTVAMTASSSTSSLLDRQNDISANLDKNDPMFLMEQVMFSLQSMDPSRAAEQKVKKNLYHILLYAARQKGEQGNQLVERYFKEMFTFLWGSSDFNPLEKFPIDCQPKSVVTREEYVLVGAMSRTLEKDICRELYIRLCDNIQDALMKPKYESYQLLSFCRVYAALCKILGETSRAWHFCCTMLAKDSVFGVFLVACVASVYPVVFTERFSTCTDLNIALKVALYLLRNKPEGLRENFWVQATHVFDNFCRLPPSSSSDPEKLSRDLLEDSIKTYVERSSSAGKSEILDVPVETFPNMWVMKALFHRLGWEWAFNHLVVPSLEAVEADLNEPHRQRIIEFHHCILKELFP